MSSLVALDEFHSRLWSRSSLMVRASDCTNANGATALGSISASALTYIAESTGRQMKQCWIYCSKKFQANGGKKNFSIITWTEWITKENRMTPCNTIFQCLAVCYFTVHGSTGLRTKYLWNWILWPTVTAKKAADCCLPLAECLHTICLLECLPIPQASWPWQGHANPS